MPVCGLVKVMGGGKVGRRMRSNGWDPGLSLVEFDHMTRMLVSDGSEEARSGVRRVMESGDQE